MHNMHSHTSFSSTKIHAVLIYHIKTHSLSITHTHTYTHTHTHTHIHTHTHTHTSLVIPLKVLASPYSFRLVSRKLLIMITSRHRTTGFKMLIMENLVCLCIALSFFLSLSLAVSLS